MSRSKTKTMLIVAMTMPLMMIKKDNINEKNKRITRIGQGDDVVNIFLIQLWFWNETK